MFALLKFSILALALPLSTVAADHGHLLNRRHAELAKRSEVQNTTLVERGPGSKWTYYDTQTGARGSCGQFLSNSGFTVAMNSAQMNSGLCWKQIRMTFGGKSTIAVIEDTCPGCPANGLDLTPGLFAFFSPLGAGIIYGDWEFADAAPAPAPTPTTTYVPPPPSPTTTSTWVAPKPSTTSTPLPKPSSSSVPIASYKASSSAASATPSSGSGLSPSTNNLQGMNQAFIGLGGLIVAGNGVSS